MRNLKQEIAEIAKLIYSDAKEVVSILGEQISDNTKIVSTYNYYYSLVGSDLEVRRRTDNQLLLDKTGFDPFITLASIKELIRFVEALGRSK